MNWKYFIMFFAVSAIAITACKDDPPVIENVTVFSIEALGTSFEDGAAVTSDLNGAASASDVALNASITITMSKALDASTVNSSNVTLSSASGDVDASVSSSGTSITIDPSADLQRGTMYTLTVKGLKATDTGDFTQISRSFTTEGRAPVVVPNESAMIAYWNFDGNAEDVAGNFSANNVVAVTYNDDRFGQGNSTATFDGDESIIEVPGADKLMEADDFTLSFWMKSNSDGHLDQEGNPSNHFVMGLGAFFGFQFEVPADFSSCKLAMSYVLEDDSKQSEDLWFNGSGEDKDNGGWQGWDFVADLTSSGGVEGLLKDKWAHIICTYNAATKQGRMYINGEPMKGQDFNLWPEGDLKRTVTGVTYRGVESDVEPILAFGFIKSIDSPMWADTPWGDYAKPTSNHYKGDLDDIRVFAAPFSPTDAKALYDAEKP